MLTTHASYHVVHEATTTVAVFSKGSNPTGTLPAPRVRHDCATPRTGLGSARGAW
jgi:hypothetical protein